MFSNFLFAAAYLIIGLFIVASIFENFHEWKRIDYLENFFIAIFWVPWLIFYWFAMQRRKSVLDKQCEIKWVADPEPTDGKSYSDCREILLHQMKGGK